MSPASSSPRTPRNDSGPGAAGVAAAAVFGGAFLALAVALLLRRSGTAYPLPTDMLVLYTTEGVVAGLGLLLLPRLARGTGWVSRHMTLVTWSLLLLNSSSCGGFASYGGGVRGPFWILYVPNLVFGAVALKRMPAFLLGVASVAGVVLSTVKAGAMDGESATHLLLVVPSFFLVTALVNETTLATTALRQRAQEDRRSLERHIDELSGALAVTAAGDLSRTPQLEVHDDVSYARPLHQLSGSLGETVGSLRTLVDHVRGGGEQLAASATELLASAEQTAAGATQ